MKIGIVGAGGVGGYLAARLAKSGEEVYLVARGEHLEAIEKEGLRLVVRDEEIVVHPAAVSDDPADFGERMDAVLFCVKGYDLQDAAKKAAPMIGPDTLLVPFGNGVGNAQTLRSIYPQNPVANGAIYIVSHIQRPGVVKVAGRGALAVIGTDGPVPQRLQALGDALKKAGIKTIVSDRITTEVWKKFLLIAAMATLTSCHDAPMGEIVEKHKEELRKVLDEILAVGRAEGARLDDGDKAKVLEQVAKVPYDSPTSMWLDFKAGRKTELEQITGYVVKKAREHGIEVPTIAACYEVLKSRQS